ncbi:hypothetical protein BDV27DRAFT_121509, partial [Aspergillus caelatus]
MSQKQISVTFEGIDSWEDSREKVDDTLAELTGTNEYPATRSLPPIIFGIEISEEGIGRLRSIDGVVVRVHDEKDH